MNTSILDVAIGLIFVYLLCALMCSVVQELLAGALAWRAKNLKAGIQRMLNDPTMSGLAASLYADPRVQAFPGSGQLPSYISGQAFAAAMVDILSKANRLESELSGPLGPFLRRAEGDLESLRADLANWFDSAMDRLGGSYKRFAQRVLLLLGLLVAVVLNIDSLGIAQSLWTSPDLRQAVVEQASAYYAAHPQVPAATTAELKQAIQSLPLPIGWHAGNVSGLSFNCASMIGWLGVFAGWLITALATSLGAHFWFNTLGRALQLRAAGKKPPLSAATD